MLYQVSRRTDHSWVHHLWTALQGRPHLVLQAKLLVDPSKAPMAPEGWQRYQMSPLQNLEDTQYHLLHCKPVEEVRVSKQRELNQI